MRPTMHNVAFRPSLIALLGIAVAVLLVVGCRESSVVEPSVHDNTGTAAQSVITNRAHGGGAAVPNAKVFRATINPLGNSGVQGTATFRIQDNTLFVNLNAQGHEPGVAHAQHIHTGDNCSSFDGIEQGLTPFPIPENQGGAIHYKQTFSPVPVTNLGDRTVVLHAANFTPVACGEINPVN